MGTQKISQFYCVQSRVEVCTCCECPLLFEGVVTDDIASCDPILWSPDILIWSCDVCNGWLEAVLVDVGRDIPTVIQTQHIYRYVYRLTYYYTTYIYTILYTHVLVTMLRTCILINYWHVQCNCMYNWLLLAGWRHRAGRNPSSSSSPGAEARVTTNQLLAPWSNTSTSWPFFTVRKPSTSVLKSSTATYR